jgi:hypothetical protein
MFASPLFAEFDDPTLFRRVYLDHQRDSTVAIYELR